MKRWLTAFLLVFVILAQLISVNAYIDEDIVYKTELIGSFTPSVTITDNDGNTTESTEDSRTYAIEVREVNDKVYAYMANKLGLFVYNVTDFDNVVKIQYIPELAGQGLLAVSGDKLYYSYADEKLYCFNIKSDGTVDIQTDGDGITSPSCSGNYDILVSVDNYVFAYQNYLQIKVFDASSDKPLSEVATVSERAKYKRQMAVEKVGAAQYRLCYIQQNESDFELICVDFDASKNIATETVKETVSEWTTNTFGKMAFLTDTKIAVANKRDTTKETLYTVDFAEYYDSGVTSGTAKLICETFGQTHNTTIVYAGNIQKLNENEVALWNKESFIKTFENGKQRNLGSSGVLGDVLDAKDFAILGGTTSEFTDYLACDGTVLALKMTRKTVQKQELEEPVVINNSWKGLPSDAIGIYGYGFECDGTAAKVVLTPENEPGAKYYLDILSSDNTYIEGVIPTSMPSDNYVCYVECGNKKSVGFTINTPSVDWISEPEICSGQSVRIFGRNFLNADTNDGSKTKVWLKTLSGSEVETTVTNATDYTIDFEIPDGIVAGEKYVVRVSNNGENSTNAVVLEDSEAVAGRTNANFETVKSKFGVSIGWADMLKTDKQYNVKDYGAVGDGTTDDTAAVEAAFAAAKTNSGGIIYFPSGTYNLKTQNGLTIPDYSVVCGDSKVNTKLLIESRITSSSQYSGICNLAIVSEKVRPADDTARYISGYVGPLLMGSGSEAHFFITGLDVRVADGSSFVSYDSRHIVIENSAFDVSHNGPMQQSSDITKIRKMRFLNNYVKNTQRPLLFVGGYSWIDGCRFVGANAGDDCEKINGVAQTMEHRIADLYGDKIFYGNNDISGIIGDARADYDDSCGEGICNQANKRIALGTAVDSTSNTLVTNLDFDDIKEQDMGKHLIGSKVVILSGNGVGQIRKIIAADANTITVDKPWDLPPRDGDTYAINGEIAEKYIIVNNNITAETRKGGIMLYTSSYDNIIENNTMTNGGGIWFGKTRDEKNARAEIAYFNYVANNNLSGGVPSKTGGQRDNALYIGVGDDGGAITNSGVDYPSVSQYANMYKANVIDGNGTDIVGKSAYNSLFVDYNGIVLATPQEGFDVPISKGVIVSNNTVENSVNGIYVPNTVSDTLIYNNAFRNNANNYNNKSSDNSVVVFKPDGSKVAGDKLQFIIAEYNSDGDMINVDVTTCENNDDAYQNYVLQNIKEGNYIKMFAFNGELQPMYEDILFQ